MFARIKKSGDRQYLQVVENKREGSKVAQRVIATIGRLDHLQQKGDIETLIRSLSRFSEQALLIVSGKSRLACEARKIGPALIFERLWKELGIPKVIEWLLADREFLFDVERAVFLTVVHRLFHSGSDRCCDKWRRDYAISGTDELSLHHLYRAMAYLGEELEDQTGATPFSPRCTKDLIEEGMFLASRHLFSGLDVVFFDTTSLCFQGEGGESLGEKGFSKDNRPDLNQMVLGVALDDKGRPLCCQMWPGNTADVKTLVSVAGRIRRRFQTGKFCVVADRGMVSVETVEALERQKIPYIFGMRMRSVKEVSAEVLSRAGRYREVHPEGKCAKDLSPLKVKQVLVGENRYIVCLNPRQARKDAADRQAILDSLKEQLARGAKSLIGNKGYRKFLKLDRESATIDMDKAKAEERFDGKWVLKTNTGWPAEKVAMKYKQLWQVEHAFRDLKSTFETRPVFHQRDDAIRGHVFCSFLALALRHELDRRLEAAGHCFEWADVKQDLKALQEVTLEESGKRLAVRTRCIGTCGKVFQAAGVAVPPAIRDLPSQNTL